LILDVSKVKPNMHYIEEVCALFFLINAITFSGAQSKPKKLM